jgi:YVTN family beta-propeller protein
MLMQYRIVIEITLPPDWYILDKQAFVRIAVNPVNNKIYVTNEFSNSVSVISGILNSVTNTITVGNFPYTVAVNPFNSRVYFTNRSSDSISVIDDSKTTILDKIQYQITWFKDHQ